MVASSRRQRLIVPLAPLVAGIAGITAATVCTVLPTGTLEALAVDSGIAAVLAAAEPPLGLTARLVLALLCGGGLALVVWAVLFVAVGRRAVVMRRGRRGDAPVLRRADAHPDAPARHPVLAHLDLGTPFLDVRAQPQHCDADTAIVEQPPLDDGCPLPADLDQPLHAYAAAVSPFATSRPQTFAPGERLEAFALTPPPPTDTAATIHALLDRLERSVPRRAAEPRRESMEDTLTALRKLATREA